MNWISNVVPPKIRSLLRRDTPENLWVKCPESGELVFHKDLEANLMVVPGSGYHMPISPKARLASLLDDGIYEEFATPETPSDPLKFRDIKRYSDRLKENRAKTGAADAVTVAFGRLEGQDVTVAIQDFAFQGGTLGLAAGEAIVAGITAAIERATPFLIFTTSGGARMQEGMFALTQMVRTTVAVRRLRAAKLPYIVILTNPTTGGVTASYAMLGDVHIAEPGAVIGFAGARVIEQTIRERLPEGFQRAEYLRDHGMVDMVVPRPLQRQTLARLCRLLTRARPPRKRPERSGPACRRAPVKRAPVLFSARDDYLKRRWHIRARFRGAMNRSQQEASVMAGSTERAVLAGGCFWGMQDLIRRYPGVISTRVGYSGGEVPNATYRNHGNHAEAIEIIFDPAQTSYRKLLEFFFQIHDPTTRNRQGNDVGASYRSAIFFTNDEQKRVALDTIADVEASGLWPGKVVTEVAPAGPFWQAEPEHQDYLERFPNGYTCHLRRAQLGAAEAGRGGRIRRRASLASDRGDPVGGLAAGPRSPRLSGF